MLESPRYSYGVIDAYRAEELPGDDPQQMAVAIDRMLIGNNLRLLRRFNDKHTFLLVVEYDD